MRGGRQATAVALALLLVGGLPAVAAADTVAFSVKDSRVTESSGLARDVDAGLYWTANDSGSDGTVFGIDPKGAVRGTLNYRARPVDVEAVARHGDRLYVADIGDNNAVRDQVTVYYFTNPRANGLTVTYHAYDFRYPDGAHDAETLLVDGAGQLYIVTKEARGGIYAAPPAPSRSRTNLLRRVGDAPALVTDGVFLPDDQGIALLTYTSIEVLDPTSYAVEASAPIPRQQQAESLALSLKGDSLLVGSEGRNSKVFAVPVPGAATPTATPSATTGPSDSGEDPNASDAAAPSSSRRGTLLAVGLAGVVALVAGVVVTLVRRPG
jgi:hypothetical protein